MSLRAAGISSLDVLFEAAANPLLDVTQVPHDVLEAFAEGSCDPIDLVGPRRDASELEDLRRWLDFAPPEDRDNAVFMDTTTLATVHELVNKRSRSSLTPVTLWDLVTFATNVVIYDHIFHFSDPDVDDQGLNDAIGDRVFASIPIPATRDGKLWGASDAVRDLWEETQQYLSEMELYSRKNNLQAQELNAMQAGWEKVLGRPVRRDQLVDELEPVRWESDGPRLLKQLAEVTSLVDPRLGLGRAPSDAVLRRVVSECNHRSYFNDRVAALLGLPYAPNTARLPFRLHLYRRAVAVQEKLATVGYIEREYQRLADAYALPTEGNLRLPVFLAATIARVSKLEEFYEVLAEIRAKASQFRSHRAELDEAIREGDLRVLPKLRQAVEDDTGILCDLVGFGPTMAAIGAVLALASGGPISVVLAGLIVLVGGAKALPHATLERLQRRLLKPEYWFLADVAASAKGMTNALPKISELWNLEEPGVGTRDSHAAVFQREFAERFEDLAELRYA